MRRHPGPILLITIAFVFATGCVRLVTSASPVRGSGNKASQTREVDPFQKIKLRGSANLVLRIGDQPSVEVIADDNLLDLITTDASTGTLVVSSRKSYSTRIGVLVMVTTPVLEAVSVHGSGDVEFSGAHEESLRVSIHGSGDIAGAGRAERLVVTIHGSGDVELFDLQAQTTEVEIFGSGNAEVRAEAALDVSIHGSGDVIYRGDPPKVRETVRGSGDVVPR